MAETEQHERWYQPQQSPDSKTLMVSNSLCGEKVPFVVNGRQVTWYICGPTVYDSSHVGHARNYVTFDIIRRILEDYFGYEVFYVMNVTDVDDKIILRARRNYLLERYRQKQLAAVKGGGSPADTLQQVRSDISSALAKSITSQGARVAQCEADMASTTESRAKEELTEAAAQEKLKLDKLLKAQAELAAITPVTSATSSEFAPLLDPLLSVGGDALASSLDASEGQGVTDIDIYRAHAARYEQEFFEDMARLGVRSPSVLTRVSEYIPEIVAYVERIIANGFGYEANGSVYFDTAAFRKAGHFYGKLCPWAVGAGNLAAEGEMNFATSEKRGKNDFVLWKASKPGEPTWPSPWGRGRPGWHIECSAMASDLIQGSVDIHSGGTDLRFPHHDNELAQAEACCEMRQWVNYFLHSGHLHIEGHKMSKSLKNFITIREALQLYSPRQLRLLFLLQAWDRPFNFGTDSITKAAATEATFRNLFQNVDVAVREADKAAGDAASGAPGGVSRGHQKWGPAERSLNTALRAAQREVHARLCDNFDTAGVMSVLLSLVTDTNKYLEEAMSAKSGEPPRTLLLRQVAAYVMRILHVFGVDSALEDQGRVAGFCDAAGGEGGAGGAANLAPYLDAFASFRDAVRASARGVSGEDLKKDLLALCDRVRDETLVDLGVRLEDRTGQSAVWKLDDPVVLRKERDEKARAAAEAAAKKLENKVGIKRKDVARWEKAAADPVTFFQGEGAVGSDGKVKYTAWTEAGIPTTDGEGKELSAKAKKGVEKDMAKAVASHDEYVAKEAKEPGFLEAMKAELAGMEAELAKLTVA
eukprot:jgi/Mesvir1/20470/Mv12360-RA.1